MKKNNKDKTIQIRVDISTYEELKRSADSLDLTFSEYVRKVLTSNY